MWKILSGYPWFRFVQRVGFEVAFAAGVASSFKDFSATDEAVIHWYRNNQLWLAISIAGYAALRFFFYDAHIAKQHKAIIEKVRRKALTKNGGANEEPELPMNLPPVDRPKKPVDR